MDHRVARRFYAAMIAVDRRMPADRGILEILGFLLGDENLDVVMQCSLIALERKDVIGLLGDDLLGNDLLGDDLLGDVALKDRPLSPLADGPACP